MKVCNFLSSVNYVFFQISEEEKNFREQEIIVLLISLGGFKLELEYVYKVCKFLQYFLGVVRYFILSFIYVCNEFVCVVICYDSLFFVGFYFRFIQGVLVFCVGSFFCMNCFFILFVFWRFFVGYFFRGILGFYICAGCRLSGNFYYSFGFNIVFGLLFCMEVFFVVLGFYVLFGLSVLRGFFRFIRVLIRLSIFFFEVGSFLICLGFGSSR